MSKIVQPGTITDQEPTDFADALFSNVRRNNTTVVNLKRPGYLKWGVALAILALVIVLVVKQSESATTNLPEPLAQPYVASMDSEDSPVVEQQAPTLDQALSHTGLNVIIVDVRPAAISFNTVHETHVQPVNIGLSQNQTGDTAYDAAVTLKYAYGNTASPEEMRNVMASNGQYLKDSALSGNAHAARLREQTYQEFKVAAENLLFAIPDMGPDELNAVPNNFGYYMTGMAVLATSPEETMQYEYLLEQAAQAIAQHSQKLADETSAQNSSNTAASAQSNLSEAPQPDIYQIPEANLTQVVMSELAISETEFPAELAPATGGVTIGLSLSPDGVVLALQQISAIINTKTAQHVNIWIVWDVTMHDTPFGTVWSFVLINEETVKDRWNELSDTCRSYMSDMLTNPRRPNLVSLQDYWGQESCSGYISGDAFNNFGAASLLDHTNRFGKSTYLLHHNQDGLVDMTMSAWFGFGEYFPLKVGQRVVRENLAVGLTNALVVP